MSKLTDIEQMFADVMIDGTPYRIAGTDIVERINKYISETLKVHLAARDKAWQERMKVRYAEVIGDDELLSPTNRTLHNHGIEARNTLRAEQRRAAGITAKGDNHHHLASQPPPELSRNMYTCGACGKTFESNPNPTACAVLHAPGQCCHYNDKVIT